MMRCSSGKVKSYCLVGILRERCWTGFVSQCYIIYTCWSLPCRRASLSNRVLQSVEEAKYYSATSIKSGIIPAADNGVSKSDNLIPESLRTSIQQLADSLRADPTSSSSSAERQQNSPNQQTRNLLDPYLYPFIWERTKVIRRDWNPPITREDSISRMGEGFEVKQPPEGDCRQDDPAKYPNEMAWSRRFQWLSFDVLFDREGGGVRYVES